MPPAAFALAWILAIAGVTPFGTSPDASFDELALRWMLLIGAGCSVAFSALAHTVFARQTAKGIGWETNGFQYELGFTCLAMGLAAIYASTVDVPPAWVTASIASGLFLLLAGINHVRTVFSEHNHAPGQTVILISDFGIPISLFVLLISTGAIL